MAFLKTSSKLRILNNALFNLSQSHLNIESSPSVIIWLLTKRCNFTCKHCESYLSKSKINTIQLVEHAKKIANSKAEVIVISGGEPFIIPNIQEILKILKDANKTIMINTNGYNLENHIDFLVENKIESITISFDSHIEEIHNSIRNKSDSYLKSLSNIEELKNKRKNGLPFLTIRGVVMKNNYKHLPEFITYFKKIADDVKLQPVHDYEGFDSVVDKSVLFDPDDKQTELDFENMLSVLFKEHPDFKNDFHKSFKNFFFSPELMKVKALNYCLPMWINTLAILEDGTCKTCSKVIGNLNSSNINEIWNNKERIQFWRSISKQGKCNVPCWLNCTTRTTEFMGIYTKKLLSVGKIEDQSWKEFEKSPHFDNSDY